MVPIILMANKLKWENPKDLLLTKQSIQLKSWLLYIKMHDLHQNSEINKHF